MLRALHHPNIVTYLDGFADAASGRHHIVMEFCREGDLAGWIKASAAAAAAEPAPATAAAAAEDAAMLRFVQLCLALQYVHARGIIHRDVKPGNIFLSAHGIVKLGDFGIARVLAPDNSCAHTAVGTPFYFSPEIVEDKPYSRKSDVWAAGCCLYELLSGRRPFSGQSMSAVCVKILRGAVPTLPPGAASPGAQRLLAALLTRSPRERPSMEEVLRMPYVQAHLRRYRAHVERCVQSRKASYKAAVQRKLLPAEGEEKKAPAKPPLQSFVKLEALCAAAAVTGAASGSPRSHLRSEPSLPTATAESLTPPVPGCPGSSAAQGGSSLEFANKVPCLLRQLESILGEGGAPGEAGGGSTAGSSSDGSGAQGSELGSGGGGGGGGGGVRADPRRGVCTQRECPGELQLSLRLG